MLVLKGEHRSAIGVTFDFPFDKSMILTRAQPISPAECTALDQAGWTKTSCNLKALLSTAL